MDDTGLRGGAAHVEGNRVLEAERMAQRLGADDTGGGTDSSMRTQWFFACPAS